MLLYCNKCNNLIYKTYEETRQEGETLIRSCSRCGNENRYYVKYNPVIDKKWDKLTDKEKTAIIVGK
jgi:DNA-directed RNA polymerase subunit M/transcription elongation factor TFIIS